MTNATRARPLSVEDRRASIIAAVIPLLLEHGTGVTSRQISEAAGVAEGTVFRAFGDKDSLIDAAYDAFMSGALEAEGPLPDPALPLEEKVAGFLAAMRSRVRDVMRMTAVTGRRPSTPTPTQSTLFQWRLREVFGPHAHELALDIDDFGAYLRVVAIGTTMPGTRFDDDSLVRLVLDGARRAAPRLTPGKD
ncbi:TetR/AcrR family transcriptional regulator [Salinibacterium soli]|uniref:TetR/AcrR family transcriptional regulator n=1 Tax=Antiquaquibacter soli TaxID=3064523 RepID=A0ABT9BKI0_9MICO|nr:TetR/AcrR family transcriptional regulator [Protaetiibacter sp. WY-16]MDO7881526.1 TetR/AcrR family transcriptional regulator [Protaetiibacter sp. WY-16]